ncbi:hypothetical protein V1512DRAFT_115475 [Lipomyces arxii]|uniref:uncharacterized protein n=1 Tax=Lipomyces arxii TaxID=56418 RepID=UPI0034CE479D
MAAGDKEISEVVMQECQLVDDLQSERGSTVIAKEDSSDIQVTAEKLSSSFVTNKDAPLVKDENIIDAGWKESSPEKTEEVIKGISNDDLWMMVRRFNQQIYHVKQIEHTNSDGIDLNTADGEEFGSPNKLRTVVERLYVTALVGVATFAMHIVRIRSWKEGRRTLVFLTAYSVGWINDLLMPMFMGLVILLLTYPPSRTLLLPPAPVNMTDSSGGVKSPPAGVLGSTGSLTGAPENFMGEATEKEARNLTSGLASIALSSATGDNHQRVDSNDQDEETINHDIGTANMGLAAVTSCSEETMPKNGQQQVLGSDPQDKTKKPMEEALWTQIRPAVHIISDAADTWERFHNLIFPRPHFPCRMARIRLLSLLGVLFLVTLKVTPYMIVKSATFIGGFLFFGDPVLQQSFKWLNTQYPNWMYYLQLRNTILKGVPTNAQITVTLLRAGELARTPLPPQPRKSDAPPDKPAMYIDNAESCLPASDNEIKDAQGPIQSIIERRDQPLPTSKRKAFIEGIRSAAKISVKTALAIDHASAKIGMSTNARGRLGIIPNPHSIPLTGPTQFHARHDGKRGFIFITDATVPELGFVHCSLTRGPKEIFRMPISSIREMKKDGGLGWKSEMLVTWALQSNIRDSLQIFDKNGAKLVFTALDARDELFNRVLGLGGQKWEVW